MRARSTFRNPSPVFSMPDFHVSINKERARTDRTGLSFSLILLGVPSEKKQSTVRKLISLLQKRVRSIDIIGWFDTRHLAVLLPSTNLDGCRELAADLSDFLNGHGSCAAVSFFSYPAQKLEMQMIWERSSSPA